jgi:hypothetical protein
MEVLRYTKSGNFLTMYERDILPRRHFVWMMLQLLNYDSRAFDYLLLEQMTDVLIYTHKTSCTGRFCLFFI